MRLLLVMWDGGGVVPPELGLARRLIGAGHEVHVLADPTIEAEAIAVGCAFTPWVSAPHVRSRRAEDAIIRDWEYSNPLKMMKTYLSDFLAGPAPRWAADVSDLLDEKTFDGALVDWALPAAMIPIEARRLPVIGLMPNCWVVPTKGIPPMGPGFSQSTNPVAQARDGIMRTVALRLFDGALPALNQTRAAYGLPPARSTVAQMLTGHTLVLSSPAFDFTSPYQPDTAIYTGPILDDPIWAGEWHSPWSQDDDRPLVVVAMSSGFQDQAPTLNRVADALKELPVRALMTLGQGIDPTAVPARSASGDVAVMASVPHSVVLAEADVVVTHCGHGTTMKSLVAGVPLLCLPMGRDQNDVAARVVCHGAGLRLKSSASETAIRKAIRRLLSDADFRRSAKDLGRRIHSGEGCVDPVMEIERLIPEHHAGERTGSKSQVP